MSTFEKFTPKMSTFFLNEVILNRIFINNLTFKKN